jgi:hypothetical protein
LLQLDLQPKSDHFGNYILHHLFLKFIYANERTDLEILTVQEKKEKERKERKEKKRKNKIKIKIKQ